MALGCCVVAVATISVALVDQYVRRAITAGVEARYFADLREIATNIAKAELLDNGCDVEKGIKNAHEFFDKERRHMALESEQPRWGWQIQGYSFKIAWHDTWVAKFKLKRTRQPWNIVVRDVNVNPIFKTKIRKEVCPLLCAIKCILP